MTTPLHIAIVMDGNGRWAQRRNRPRSMGHQAGVKAARRVVEACGKQGVKALTLFAFSSENWQRPPSEVRGLLDLFLKALNREIQELNENGARLTFVGDLSRFSPELQQSMRQAEQLTINNDKLDLAIAVNYGGRWDFVQAARKLARQVADGLLDPEDIDLTRVDSAFCLRDRPDPDLLIRTGGEYRLSNFLLWQMAYTELYFTDTLWPDFGAGELEQALADYATRQRRFGLTGDQAKKAGNA